ncbi:MAG: hypothetical protein JSS08_15265 [Proteobacteria bacterium]|nr:hypothetical protein [Pseudomonadota bacterium]
MRGPVLRGTTGGAAGLDKVHFAIGRLLGAPEGWRPLVREMVARWPDAAPGEIIFTIVSAATEIEATFAPGSPAREAADHGWRLAALVGTDLYAMEAIGLPRARAADLAAYWQIDPFFRDL